jgi:hypothetical protein
MSVFQGAARSIRSGMFRFYGASPAQHLTSAAGIRSGLGHRLFTVASARQSAQNKDVGDRRDVNPRRAENSESDDKAAELDTAYNPKETAPEREIQKADKETAEVRLQHGHGWGTD